MKQIQKKKIAKNNKGFTLLEILVVLTIMGFLIAMVAPRLAGISGGAVDTVCDSNQSRTTSMMSGYFEQTNKFPNKVTNLVEETAADTFQIPAVSDDNPENGAETLASEFMSRNHFRIHYLSDAEIAELRGMGITQVFNLNAYDAYEGTAVKSDYPATAALAGTLGVDAPNDVDLAGTVTRAPKMEEVTLAADQVLAVAMVGIGRQASTAATPFTVHADERGWGEPDWFGRIVVGLGPENGLVTSGIVANAAHCPGGIQNADNVTYNDYNLVLPRLSATADLMDDTAIGANISAMDSDTTKDGVQLQAVAYDEEPAASYDFASSANAGNLKTRTFTITDAQERWQYATQCPEGHMFPADDEEFWGISLNADAILD